MKLKATNDLEGTRIFALCMILFCNISLSGQDVFFSDFMMTQTSINPALTGSFDGTYRFNGIYSGLTDQTPFRTSSFRQYVASIEFNLNQSSQEEGGRFSAGLSLYSEDFGAFQFKQNLATLNLAYHYQFSNPRKSQLSVGVNLGRIGTSLDDINPPTQFNQINKFDVSAGIMFSTELNETTQMKVGGSWLQAGRQPANSYNEKYVLFGKVDIKVSSKFDFSPALLFITTPGEDELQIQGVGEYMIYEAQQINLIFGAGARPIPDFNTAYVIGGVRFNDLSLRMNYNVNFSSLRPLGGNRFELGIVFTGGGRS